MKTIEVFDRSRSGSMFARYIDSNGNMLFVNLGNGYSVQETADILAKRIGLSEYRIVEIDV